jgi:predicted outer membrane repeat protein
LTLNNSSIIDNETRGIYNDGDLTLQNSTVSGNTVTGGGGGIIHGIVTVVNSTISNNSATGDGGGIYGGTVNIYSSTISGNSAGNRGGGIYNSNVDIQNSILVGNTASRNGPDCYGTLNTSGYNIIGNPTDCTYTPTTGDKVGADPLLGPLQDNGGPTFTHAIPITSPAIDVGNPSGCVDHRGIQLMTDQRDFPRVGTCDIGAYEYPTTVTRLYLPCVMRDYCAPMYMDDFHEPGSGWPIVSTADVQTEYLDDEYRVVVKSSYYWTGASSGFKASDHITAVDLRNTSAIVGSYGVIFSISDDWGEFYTFEIDRDGYYAVFKFNYGSWSTLINGWSDDIQTGSASNRIKVERNGTSIKIYANGVLLATLSDGSFTGLRRVGLIVSAYDYSWVDIRFDNFAVYPITCTEGAANIAQGGTQTYLWEAEFDGAWMSGSNTKDMRRGE